MKAPSGNGIEMPYRRARSSSQLNGVAVGESSTYFEPPLPEGSRFTATILRMATKAGTASSTTKAMLRTQITAPL